MSEIALSQLPNLTFAEKSGGVAASYFERRNHMLPRDWPSAVSRFLSPSTDSAPKPSAASQPMPRRQRPAA
jgi:hypothetical protein